MNKKIKRQILKRMLASISAATIAFSVVSAMPGGVFNFTEIDIMAGATVISGPEDIIVYIDEEHFPDANFRQYVKDNCNSDLRGPGWLTRREIEFIKSINASNRGIKSIKGIEYFTYLESLDVSNNNLSGELDIGAIAKSLKTLNCKGNPELSSIIGAIPSKFQHDHYFQNAKCTICGYTHTNHTYKDNRCEVCHIDRIIEINETNFPDANFRSYVSQFDTDGNGILSADEASSVKELDVQRKGISDLKGIEFFTALTELYCGSNQITSLDVSHNTALTDFYCEKNQITSLDVSHNTDLVDLHCENNQITSLDVSHNTALVYLYCGKNQLTSLKVGNNTVLKHISCEGNKFKSLDISQNTGLICLWCTNNPSLTSIIFANNTLPSVFSHDCHEVTEKEGKAPTCTETGLTEGTNCEWCGKTIKAQNEIPAKGHKYENGRCTLCGSVEINETNFPDSNFRSYISEKFDADGNKMLSTDDINNIKEINVSSRNISNLKGIEFFTALTNLNCEKNQLKSLDLRQNKKIVEIICNNNQLTSLDLSSNTSLKYLHCNYNQLTKIDVSKNKFLEALSLTGNPIESIDLSNNTSLKWFWCYNSVLKSVKLHDSTILSGAFGHNCHYENGKCTVCGNTNISIDETNFPDSKFRSYVSQFDTDGNGILSLDEINKVTNIDVSEKGISDLTGIEFFTALETLVCSENNLEVLNLNSNTNLTMLGCDKNNLTSLDVSSNTKLKELYCYENKLESLELGDNTNLIYLYCDTNKLKSLDVGRNTNLTYFECFKNQLTSLNVSQNTKLMNLECQDNKLTSLDVNKNTKITYLDCSKNNLTSLDLSKNTSLGTLYCQGNPLLSSITFANDTPPKYLFHDCCYEKGICVICGNIQICEDTFPNANFRNYILENCDTNHNNMLSASEINKVTEIDVNNKDISDLTGIQFFTALETLVCCENQLTSLNVSKNTKLTRLECQNNPSLESITFADNITLDTFEHDCHNVILEGKPATCTESGLTEGTKCEWCGKITQQEIPAAGHKYENGKCTVCGDENTLGNLAGASLSLKGDIRINFYMELSEEILTDDSAYIEFALPNGNITQISVKDATIETKLDETNTEKTFYVFHYDVAPTDMGTTITAQIKTENASGKVYTYSVQAYADKVINDDKSNYNDATKELVQTMMDYGSYVQAYASGNNDILPENVADVSEVEIPEKFKYDPSQNANNENVKLKGASLSLCSMTTLRMHFSIENVNADGVSFTYNGKTLEKTLENIQGNNYYRVDIPDIPANELDSEFTVNVSDGTNNFDIKYTPMTYCYNVAKSETTEVYTDSLKDLVKCLYKYNQAQKDYTSSQTE